MFGLFYYRAGIKVKGIFFLHFSSWGWGKENIYDEIDHSIEMKSHAFLANI